MSPEVRVKLSEKSVVWALKSLEKLGDSDLFTRPFEFSIIRELGDEAKNALSSYEIDGHYKYGPSRRFIVPKDDLSYRVASQLDPLNSIILTALIYEHGGCIEKKRRSLDEGIAFSYRFSPDKNGRLYDPGSSWNDFWETCHKNSKKYAYVAILDVADFYNQISHHCLENQLISAGLPDQAGKWLKKLCGDETMGVSRGIPIGPHASHLLAEASLAPIDNALIQQGIKFCRYVDDIVVFVNSETEARAKILLIANTLDAQQKLQIQRHKTKVMGRKDFHKFALGMIEDRPIDDLEKDLVKIIKKHSHDDPYRSIWLSDLSDKELLKFKPEIIKKIVAGYLKKSEPDYIRLRWFVRRLAQVGHPSGVGVLLHEFSRLLPALSDICRYFLRASESEELDWGDVGHDLMTFLNNEIIQSNEYYQLSILSLFASQKKLNNLASIIRLYKNASPCLRREIIVCAAKYGAVDWLRELKESFRSFDPWSRRAFIYAAALFPADEKKYFLQRICPIGLLEELMVGWAKKQ